MKNSTSEDISFLSWSRQTYERKKEAVDFLENSSDPFEHAIGILIKKYAGVSISE
ncbi:MULTISPECIES: hypothetical protein [Methanosarcina]|uniref:hypothetical protein n=1 Tax=Methanosarcina TaxID=2207 RepID=UPI000B0F85B0|nr:MULTISPECIES: hypothetical protein [Methanosarcina]